MMGQEETIRLLQECDAGVQMGIASIQEVLPYVKEEKFRQLLLGCRDKHEKLQEEIRQKLEVNRDERKEPNLMAKGIFWMKTKGKLVLDESDATIADLMTDGCNMGIKSLHRCLNQYAEADEKAKDIAKRLINIEEKLTVAIRFGPGLMPIIFCFLSYTI